MPAAPIIVAAAVGSGAAAALGAAVVGAITAATISTAVATAVGVGVISGVSTAVQGGSSSDILRSAVVGGVSSYVGGQVASKVTSAVASQTGASLVDLEPSLRALSGEGATAAGIASITAGNVAGAATSAAITGQPIQQAALLGLAQSIPTALSGSQDFRSLNPVVQNVLASSAQAAVMGQDVGDAAIASLVASSGIVARAINEVPGGQEFIQNNPIYAKYVIDSVSSALTAQLQGKDVSESVIYSLARTTADVLSQEFQNTEKSQSVAESNQKYTQAQQEEKNVARLANELNNLRYNIKYEYGFNTYNQTAEVLNNAIASAQSDAGLAQMYANEANDASRLPWQREFARNQLDWYNNSVKEWNAYIKELQTSLKTSERELTRSGFFEVQNALKSEYDQAVNRLNGLVAEIQDDAATLAQASSDLFTDFETELATTLAPLTAFEDVTDVGDQDVLAEIQPVAPPEDLTQLAQDDAVLRQIQEVAARPDVGMPTGGAEFAQSPTGGGLAIDITIKPNIYESSDGRTVINGVGVLFEDDQAIRQLTPEEIKQISGIDVAYAPEEISNYLGQFGITKNAPVNALYVDPNGAFYVGEDLNVYDARNERIASMSVIEFQQLTGQTPTESVRVNPDTLLRTNDGKLSQTTRPTAELKPIGVGTGTPGAPPIDYSLAATDMQGTPLGEQPPFPTIGLNLLTAGTGIEGGRNKALFNTGGGFGSGGNTTETTWSIVARASETGTNDIVDVGGKLYSLILLPDKQVLVPEEPSEVVVYLERDPVTNLPKMKEVPVSTVPPQDAQQIAEKVGQTAGGAPAGAEGAAGGRTAEEDRVATTEEQLQPGARPEEVAPGVVAEQPAPSFPELVSGITEPTVPAPVPGQAAGTQTGTQAPGAGGFGDQISDEDIIRLIQGEIGTPGGGEGEGAPGEEGAGVGEGEEGVGPGAGEEGEGEGVAGEGEGTGEGVGPGTGEGGGEIAPTPEILLPSPVITTVPRRTFQRPGQVAPYRVTGQDESGILGRKGPIFGGDEDLQRAEWNRRSLRLKRLLGL